MVEYMEEGKMSELLLKDKEDGVKHVNKLWDVENPGHGESSHSFWIIGVVNRLAGPAVVTGNIKPKESDNKNHIVMPVSLLPTLREAPKAEDCLEKVVSNDDSLDFIRRTVFHVPE